MLISCLRGDLPSASLKSFFTDATGGYSGGGLVQSPPLRDRAASNRDPGHRTVLTRSSLHGDPQWTRTDQHRTYRNLCCTLYDVFVPAYVALLTELARGGAWQV